MLASPNNVLANKDFVEPKDISKCRIISHVKNSQLYKLVENIIGEIGIEDGIFMTFDNIEAIKQGVIADIGITAIPRSAVCTELEFGLLKEIKIRGKSWKYPYCLIYHKNKHLTLANRKLIEFIKEKMIKK